MVQRLRGVSDDQVSTKLDDFDAQMEDAFKKADSSKSSQLKLWQSSKAWSAFGVEGKEEELKGLFSSSERLGGMSKRMDLCQFMRVVKTLRLTRLSIRIVLASLGRKMQRQKIYEEKFDLFDKL